MTLTIKILGPGCRNCVALDRITRQAVADLGLDATVEKVEDHWAIIEHRVMTTPSLVVDDRVVLAGRVPTPPPCATSRPPLPLPPLTRHTERNQR